MQKQPSFKIFTPTGRVYEYRSNVWTSMLDPNYRTRLWWYERAYEYGSAVL